jgi:hypothetical protein
MNALEMFRMGNDYLQIAAHSRRTEAEVEKEIHLLRAKERLVKYKTEWAVRKAEARRVYMREYMRRQREAMREERNRRQA